jgi:flagellar hook-associated protein 2
MASIDGLVSGMSTTDTINQLMKLEAAPQAALKTKISTANKVVSAYQSVNTRLSSLATAAKGLGDPTTWGAMKATSTSDAVAVTAQPGAGTGSLTFRVEKLAATQVVTFTGASVASATDGSTSPVSTGEPIEIKRADGTFAPVTPKDQSLQSLVDAINGTTGAAYTASAVRIGSGQYTLQLTAKESGAAGATALNAADFPTGLSLGTPTVTVAGADAELRVGDTADAFVIASPSNTFTDVMPGVTVTAVKAQAAGDAPVRVGVAADAEGIAAKVQALVDTANVALSEIGSQSKIKNGEVSAGPLVGDSAMRKLTQDILSAVASGAAGVGTGGGTASLNDVGIGVDRSGRLTFDKQKFTETYTADPAKTQKYFDAYTDKDGGTAEKFEPGFDTAGGIARKLEAVSLMASEGVVDPTNPTKARQGVLQALIQQRNDAIRGMNDQVLAWDVRLDSRKTSLQRQFSNLEVALGKMQQQSSWLAGQLAGLA